MGSGILTRLAQIGSTFFGAKSPRTKRAKRLEFLGWLSAWTAGLITARPAQPLRSLKIERV